MKKPAKATYTVEKSKQVCPECGSDLTIHRIVDSTTIYYWTSTRIHTATLYECPTKGCDYRYWEAR
jgi:hypothetical protein